LVCILVQIYHIVDLLIIAAAKPDKFKCMSFVEAGRSKYYDDSSSGSEVEETVNDDVNHPDLKRYVWCSTLVLCVEWMYVWCGTIVLCVQWNQWRIDDVGKGCQTCLRVKSTISLSCSGTVLYYKNLFQSQRRTQRSASMICKWMTVICSCFTFFLDAL